MKTLNLIKLTLLTSILTGCYQSEEIDEYETDTESITVETDTECELELLDDQCNGDHLALYDINDSCEMIAETVMCKLGCIDEGPNNGVRCLEACEINNCPTPDPRCESTVFLTIYNKSTCSVSESGEEQCIENIGTRRYCGCVPATDNEEAHCYKK